MKNMISGRSSLRPADIVGKATWANRARPVYMARVNIIRVVRGEYPQHSNSVAIVRADSPNWVEFHKK